MAQPFSDVARAKMLDLYNNHSHEVGSVLKQSDPQKYRNYKSTSCIVYAINVIAYAYEHLGDRATAKQVRQLSEKGTELAAYLARNKRWVGVYISPDTDHPADADKYHVLSHRQVERTCSYWRIPIKFKAINYNPTPQSHPSFQATSPGRPPSKLDTVNITALSRMKFGFGVSRGGRHTWLYSLGKVYEVHWDQIGPNLYERTPLPMFPWLSGAIVVPPDEAKTLQMARVACP